MTFDSGLSIVHILFSWGNGSQNAAVAGLCGAWVAT